MTLLLAAQVGDRWLLAADRMITSGNSRQQSYSKLETCNGFTYAWAGTSPHSYAFFRKVATEKIDLFDPDAVRFACEGILSSVARMHDLGVPDSLPGRIDMACIAVKGDQAVIINQEGNVWPVKRWSSVGAGGEVADYLMLKNYEAAAAAGEEKVRNLLSWVIAEVAFCNINVTPECDIQICP